MPVYEFECPKCKKIVELYQKMAEKTAPTCCEDDCNVEMSSIISKTGFQLAGWGWARDGYKGKKGG